MAADPRAEVSDHVMDRVLRRVEVAKMARKLQDRLALASYKTKNGLDNLNFKLVEAHYDETVSKRRPGSSVGSSGSSTTSSDIIPYNRAIHSSPVTAPVFSDDAYPDGSGMGSRKRARFAPPYNAPTPVPTGGRSRRKRYPTHSSPIRSRRSQPNLSASSPLTSRFQSDFRTPHGPQLSFVSISSTISDSPQFGPSDGDAPALPPTFHGSPPRTPPPTRPRGARKSKGASNGEEGADLLLYLATSPSPAQAQKSSARMFPPSTPPQNHAALPSSLLNTPGGTNGLFAGFNTPGQQFNFSDFVNVTPSPAQGAFNRTPAAAKTPLAAKEARRRLNFDALQPPNGSPNISRSSNGGLGMDLGGELGA
ncbi:MAG: hypothetical protein MMC23_004930 [Stictis urceolatum]|nr:hypothetical protein [Stictis urceolata]